MKRTVSCLVVAWSALLTNAWAQPAGGNFQVNSYTTGGQYFPSVAMDANGSFVVVWPGNDGSDYGVAVQRFGSAGLPLGPEFLANGYTAFRQSRPAVAAEASGAFVVAWDSYGQDGSSYGIRARRFDAQGVPLAGGFAVNAYTPGVQWYPAVASNRDGRFVVLWVSQGQDGSGDSVFGRIYDEAGAAVTPAFQVNTYTTGNQTRPAVGMDAVGNVLTVHQSDGQDGWDSAIVYRRFNWNGSPAGSFVVNTSTSGYQRYPSIAVNGSGAFLVTWMTQYHDGDVSGIYARLYDSSATPQGPDFRVNTYTTGGQARPRAFMDDAGNFTVVWLSYLQDGSSNGLFGQHFDATAAPVGGEFAVNAYTTGSQFAPAIGGHADGDFVVAWSSPGDGEAYGIFGQRYGDLIFQDGFESSDLSRWSSSAGGIDLGPSGIGLGLAGTAVGLRAFMNDTQALFVQDDSPAAEDRYRARFYLDPNSLDPGESDGHLRLRVFIAFNAASQRLFTVVLRRQSGVYAVMARVRRDDGTRVNTGFFTISDAPHLLEFDWRRASGPGSADSHFEMRIDEAIVSTLSGFDNDAGGGVEFARLGLMVVKSGAFGAAYLDQFESRRQRYIGPEWP
jgi:hypothetical protein